MLEVAAALAALVEEFLFIRDPIAIGITVGVEIEGVGFADDEATIERKDHPGQGEIVDEDGMAVVVAVAIGVLVHGDTADLVELFGAIDVLHVGAHFSDIHAAVAIEDGDDGLLDLRLTEDEFKMVAVFDVESFEGFLGCERGGRRIDDDFRLSGERGKREDGSDGECAQSGAGVDNGG